MDETSVKNVYAMFEIIGSEAISLIEENAKAAGIEATPILLKGNPAEKILDFAENHKVDMIVIGSTGKSGTERFMLGSVSEKVVRHAKVPVLVVRARFKPERIFSCGKRNKKSLRKHRIRRDAVKIQNLKIKEAVSGNILKKS